ncbi:MAG: hypothetical protein IJX99_05730 [Clostridia bacterium]|nr:hypothetical protein [Clostridia bacterium]
MIILHCTLQKTWDNESKTDAFGATDIESTGSITCIRPDKVNSENFSFPTTMNHIVLCINTDAVDQDSLKFDGDYIYISKPIAPTAIVATIPYTYDNDDKFVKSSELLDIEIINEVLEKLNLSFINFKYFRDGTSSRIFLLNGQYVVKQNLQSLLKSEVEFYEMYKDVKKLQKVVLSSDENKYIVYEFIPGDVMHTVDDFDDVMANIKEIINSYKDYEKDEFGYIYKPSTSWIEFLKSEVHEESLKFSDSFDFLPHVYEAIATLEKFTFKKKLIHGDFGTHNFIKKDRKFVAAIDPIPVAGDPLYDFLYACLSNLDIVKHLSVDYLVEETGEPEEKVKAMLIIMLFFRLSVCLRHHKEDFDSYIDFWYDIIA